MGYFQFRLYPENVIVVHDNEIKKESHTKISPLLEIYSVILSLFKFI